MKAAREAVRLPKNIAKDLLKEAARKCGFADLPKRPKKPSSC